MKKLLLALALLGNSLFADMVEPYKSIQVLPFDGHGWFGNAEQLDLFLKARPMQTVIEVGSWLGCSTRHIASALPKDGVLYAIDTWAGSQQESAHLQDPRLPFLFQQFLSNVIHAKLTDKIIPIRMNSIEAAKALKVKADLIYLDGAHDTPSVMNDIDYWYPHLNEGGVLCGDDWTWDSVRVAVVDRANKLGKKVHVIANFWWYE
ncbi:putative secreted protein [Candidatus Protochlamydia naegleriophila]|uniref:Putative secreted protein n=1 Tax=Candidatus Protochlamydia naegleriophila TaxID=389348 RepID=A0A0U5JF32_9BACT|nr:class I SAM-dependent methyltransferase [Candidatus Protochlamydia naegleriophila]CUI17412.1 putative secreted protein [Candidatus Protochlamydia naegleriophila]